MIPLLLALSLSQTVEAPKKPSLLKPFIAMAVCKTTEAISTNYNVEKGYSDWNLIYGRHPNRWQTYGGSAAFTVGIGLVMRHWSKWGETWRGNASTLGWFGAMTGCTNTAINLLIVHEDIRR